MSTHLSDVWTDKRQNHGQCSGGIHKHVSKTNCHAWYNFTQLYDRKGDAAPQHKPCQPSSPPRYLFVSINSLPCAWQRAWQRYNTCTNLASDHISRHLLFFYPSELEYSNKSAAELTDQQHPTNANFLNRSGRKLHNVHCIFYASSMSSSSPCLGTLFLILYTILVPLDAPLLRTLTAGHITTQYITCALDTFFDFPTTGGPGVQYIHMVPLVAALQLLTAGGGGNSAICHVPPSTMHPARLHGWGRVVQQYIKCPPLM